MSGQSFPEFPDESVAEALEVLVANQQSTLEVDEESLISIAREILFDSDYRLGELSLAIVDDETIHELNRQYLEHDYATDVLSFLLEEDNVRIVGEIILSADTAAREASQVGWSPQTELMLYVIHGVLHLVGYDDLDAESRKAMRQREREYLVRAGVESAEIENRLPDSVVPDDPRSNVDAAAPDESLNTEASE